MMKNYILLLLIASATIVGCKKDKNEKESNTQKFQGKWKVTHTKRTSLKDGQVVETQEEIDGTLIFEFVGNTLKLNENNSTENNYSYTVENDELVIRMDNDAVFFKYKFNSATQLELSQSETVTEDNITYEDKMTYVMSKE